MMIIIRKENGFAYDEITHEIAISSAIVQVLPLRYNLRQGAKERKATRTNSVEIRDPKQRALARRFSRTAVSIMEERKVPGLKLFEFVGA